MSIFQKGDPSISFHILSIYLLEEVLSQGYKQFNIPFSNVRGLSELNKSLLRGLSG